MNLRHGWLVLLAIAALLVAACGPGLITPTPREETAVEEAAAKNTATTAPTGDTAAATGESAPAEEPLSVAELPVDADDWHVLGSQDAPVTIVEYSDFQ